MEKLAIEGGKPAAPNLSPLMSYYGENEKRMLLQLFEPGFEHTSLRKRFEDEFAQLVGAKFGIGTNSCTSSLHVATVVAGVGPGDEVLCTAISDISTACCALAEGAIPIFVDVEPGTYNLDPSDMERKITDKTKAMLVVHMFGASANMGPIMDIANKHDLVVIEDCAQALLAEYKGKVAGSIGDMGCFSFLGGKHMSTGGHGGMITTSNPNFAEACHAYVDLRGCRNSERKGQYFRVHERLGLNYRMLDVMAALGLGQLAALKERVQNRINTAQALDSILAEIDGLDPVPTPSYCTRHTYWAYPIRVGANIAGGDIYKVSRALNAEGVYSLCKEYFLLYPHPIYQEQKAYNHSHYPWSSPEYGRKMDYGKIHCPNAEDILAHTFVIHINDGYTSQDHEKLAHALRKVADAYRD